MPIPFDPPDAQTFQRHCEDFRAASVGQPPLLHVLIMFPPHTIDAPAPPWCFTETPQGRIGAWSAPDGEPFGSWFEDPTPSGAAPRPYRHLFYGNADQLDLFRELAGCAAPVFYYSALRALGGRRNGKGLSLHCFPSYEYECWMRLMYGFMWQWRRHPSSPLRGNPYAWQPGLLRDTPYDDIFVPPENPPLVSALPFDVFRCSVEFIEALRRFATKETALPDKDVGAVLDKALSAKMEELGDRWPAMIPAQRSAPSARPFLLGPVIRTSPDGGEVRVASTEASNGADQSKSGEGAGRVDASTDKKGGEVLRSIEPPLSGGGAQAQRPSPVEVSNGTASGDDPTVALEAFWERMRGFLNVMLGYGAEVRPESAREVGERIIRREPVNTTSPAGYAECVASLIDEVDYRSLPGDESALFLSAAKHFRELCERCGCTIGSGDFSGLRPPSEGDPYFQALRRLVKGRVSADGTRAARGTNSATERPHQEIERAMDAANLDRGDAEQPDPSRIPPSPKLRTPADETNPIPASRRSPPMSEDSRSYISASAAHNQAVAAGYKVSPSTISKACSKEKIASRPGTGGKVRREVEVGSFWGWACSQKRISDRESN